MENTTTLVCLFHHQDQAEDAIADLRKTGLPNGAISVIGGEHGDFDELETSELASLGMPDRDYDRLKNGVRDGGIVVAVSTTGALVDTTETIFSKHKAEKIDEVESTNKEEIIPTPSAPLMAGENVVPVLEENLVVGKRTVDAGGIRLYRRVVEIPVEESVVLREEHVNVNRVAVDYPIRDVGQAFQPQTIELTETAEEVVVAKDAHVVEEIVVNKAAVEHTETITDTVRHTEVEVEEVLPEHRLPPASL